MVLFDKPQDKRDALLIFIAVFLSTTASALIKPIDIYNTNMLETLKEVLGVIFLAVILLYFLFFITVMIILLFQSIHRRIIKIRNRIRKYKLRRKFERHTKPRIRQDKDSKIDENGL